MKNILILTTVSGFLDKFEQGNLEILLEMGYTVHYAANRNEQHYPFDEEKLLRQGVRLHHIDIARSPFLLRYNIKAAFQLAGLIKRYHIRAIHCHTPVGGILGRLMGIWFHRQKLRVVYTAHGFHFYKGAPLMNNTVYYLAEKLLAPFTDFLIVINQEDYESAKKLRLKRNGQVFQIPGAGLDVDRFSPLSAEQRKQCRERLGIGPEDFYMVAVGELNENKNHEVLLHTLAQMHREGKDITHFKLGICGDGFLRERLGEQISELGLEKNVFLYGYCFHVPDILGCADLSVFPSVREGFGMAGAEALAMGVPLLASENRGTREYVLSGKNGRFCRAKEISQWIKGIEAFREMSPEEMCKMKQFCRKSVLPFRKEHTAAIMRIVYENLDTLLESGESAG